MRCCRQHIYPMNPSSWSRSAIYRIIENFKDCHSLLIGIVVIVAVLGSVVYHLVLHLLISFKIVLQSGKHLIPCEPALVIDVVFYRGKDVGNTSKSHTLYICGIISCSSSIVIFTVGNTVFKK